MKKLIQFSVLLILSRSIVFFSCKKEQSCEGCVTNNNKPPTAVAGPDQVITLPTDSVSLDGRTSSDPDGMISSCLWTKISGPVSFYNSSLFSCSQRIHHRYLPLHSFDMPFTFFCFNYVSETWIWRIHMFIEKFNFQTCIDQCI